MWKQKYYIFRWRQKKFVNFLSFWSFHHLACHSVCVYTNFSKISNLLSRIICLVFANTQTEKFTKLSGFTTEKEATKKSSHNMKFFWGYVVMWTPLTFMWTFFVNMGLVNIFLLFRNMWTFVHIKIFFLVL
jgi:hypothetical protein